MENISTFFPESHFLMSISVSNPSQISTVTKELKISNNGNIKIMVLNTSNEQIQKAKFVNRSKTIAMKQFANVSWNN